MTSEEVRVALGFQPWLEFAREAATRPLDHLPLDHLHAEQWRRTGRSTMTIVDAVSELTEGRQVLLVGVSLIMARYHEQLCHEYWRRVSKRIDSSRTRVASIQKRPEEILQGNTSWLLIDHTVDEQFPDRGARLRELWHGRLIWGPVPTPPPVIQRQVAWGLLLESSPWD